MANGRGVKKVNESIMQDGRTLIITEESNENLNWERIPDGTLKIHPVTGNMMVKIRGEADWIPAGLSHDGTITIAKDAKIIYEVFRIKRANNGDGTFTYINQAGEERTKPLTVEGYQAFELEKGSYVLKRNKIEVYINDALHRSAESGGLVEIDETRFALEDTAANNTEVTAKYFERVDIGNPYPRFWINNEEPERKSYGDFWMNTVNGRSALRWWNDIAWVNISTKEDEMAADLASATSAATAGKLARRDSSGRMRAAVPAHEDDVARKKETDAALAVANAAVKRAGDTMTGSLGINGHGVHPYITAPSAATSAASYPLGITTAQNATVNGYPEAGGIIVTYKFSETTASQWFYSKGGAAGADATMAWARNWNSVTGWTYFKPLLALGERSADAYRGDRGKTAYDHSQVTDLNPHGTHHNQLDSLTFAAGLATSADGGAFKHVSDAMAKKWEDHVKTTTIGSNPHNSTLASMKDTTLATIVAGNFIRHNGTAWVNANLAVGDIPELPASKITSGTLAFDRLPTGTGANQVAVGNHNHTLDALSNTSISSNTIGEILKWNGTAWVNNTLSEAGIQPTITGAATTIDSTNLAASRALVSDASGKVAVASITATELGYLDGVTSALQTQLNGKAPSTHTHTIAQVTGLQTALNGKQDSLGSGTNAQYLRGDGSWAVPPDTKYSAATTTADGLMSAGDKTKLNGIATGANNYSHPTSHPASIITQDANNRFVTDAEKGVWNGKASGDHNHTLGGLSNVTISTAGPSGGALGDIWIQV